MGQHDAIRIKQVAEHQIVNMTTMSRHIDEGMGIVEISDAVQTADADTAIYTPPEPSEKNQKQSNIAVSEIGRDGLGHPISFLTEPSLPTGFPAGLGGMNSSNRLPYLRCFDHLRE